MITVKNFKLLEEVPNTYGFISLGVFSCNIENFLTFNSKYSCSCSIEDKEFDILVFKVGVEYSYIVLADLNSIPAEIIVDESEIKEKIKESLEFKLINENSYLGLGSRGWENGFDISKPIKVNYNDLNSTNANYSDPSYITSQLSSATF